MDQELNRLLAKVSNQDMLVKRLNQQHHEITQRLVKERGIQYRLQQDLKAKHGYQSHTLGFPASL